MFWLDEKMQSCELVTLVSSLSCCIAKGKTAEELTFLSALFILLGDNLDTIVAHDELCESKRKEECECECERECN